MKNSCVTVLLGFTMALAFGRGAAAEPQASDREGAATPQVVQIPGSQTSVRLWEQDGRDMYAVSLDGGANWYPSAQAETRVMLRYREFDPLQGEPPVPGALAARAGSRLHLVQFRTRTMEAYLDVLKNLGVEVHQFIPYQSFLVRMDAGTAAAVRSLPFVRWVGAFHPAYKLSGDILLDLVAHGAALVAVKYDVSLVDRRGTDQARLAEAIAAAGGRVETAPAGGGYILEATLDGTQLIEIAAEDTAMSIGKWSPGELDMDNARIQGGANYLEPQSPIGYTGKGVRGEILEGIYQTHPEFAANAWRVIPIIHNLGTGTSHGNSTFGEVFSSGVVPTARGLCPDGQGMYCNYNYVINTNLRYPHTQELVNPALIYKGMFQTASWGYSQTTVYTDRSREMDLIIFDLNLPVTQSQSNTGNQNSRPQAWAKNIISVGGINHYNNSNPADDAWSSASVGPAIDTRIKPDICGYYDNIYTTSGSTTYTTGFGGTSGATPIVAGHIGLLLEMYTDGVFGHALPMPATWQNRFQNRPHFSATKAHLINTARQYPMSQTNITRYRQGWGFPNVQDAWDLRNKTHIVDEWDVLSTLQTMAYYFFVNAGEPQFRVTMFYPDPAAAANAPIHRINDVNLRVTAPNGTLYWGNNGLAAANYSTAGGVANSRDTVENVFVQNPASGIWTVEVIAAEINQDGHVETPALDVDYALVASGIGSGRDMSGMTLDIATSGGGAGDFSATLAGLPAGWTEGWTFFSFSTGLPVGLGPVLGTQPDSIFFASFFFPPAEGDLFHFVATANPAAYPNAPFTLPPGSLSALAGLSADAIAIVLNAGGAIQAVSNADRVTF